jgi:hypothetical protein
MCGEIDEKTSAYSTDVGIVLSSNNTYAAVRGVLTIVKK